MRHTILFSTSVLCLRAGTRERGYRVLRCCCCCFFVNSLIGGVFAFRALCFQFLLSHTGRVRVECNAHRRLAPLPVVELSHLSMRAMTGNNNNNNNSRVRHSDGVHTITCVNYCLRIIVPRHAALDPSSCFACSVRK